MIASLLLREQTLREEFTFGKQKLNELGISRDIQRNAPKRQSYLKAKDKNLFSNSRSKSKKQRMRDRRVRRNTLKRKNK